MLYDAIIVGGGPAGLSAALALGRARKRVLLCDAGSRRNAAAVHIHNFVTRDGTTPDDFRRIGREQLVPYANVEVRDRVGVEAITGARGAFHVRLSSGEVEARRILLCTGMIDDTLPIPGFRELWGQSIFQCPYCHGWEVQDRRWACLVRAEDAGHVLPFALMLRGWSRDVAVFTNGPIALPEETLSRCEQAGVRIHAEPIVRLVAREQRLEAIELAGGKTVPVEVLFAHPPQRQVPLVRALGVELDDDGFVRVDPMRRETSLPGVYAGGDLITRMQAAVFAAAAGMHAATTLNLELTMEGALSRQL